MNNGVYALPSASRAAYTRTEIPLVNFNPAQSVPVPTSSDWNRLVVGDNTREHIWFTYSDKTDPGVRLRDATGDIGLLSAMISKGTERVMASGQRSASFRVKWPGYEHVPYDCRIDRPETVTGAQLAVIVAHSISTSIAIHRSDAGAHSGWDLRSGRSWLDTMLLSAVVKTGGDDKTWEVWIEI